jgi:hypothetical protein
MEVVEIYDLVQSRWMYLIEWYLKILKGYVHNKVRLERSMAKGYAFEEALGFCTKYLQHLMAIGCNFVRNILFIK